MIRLGGEEYCPVAFACQGGNCETNERSVQSSEMASRVPFDDNRKRDAESKEDKRAEAWTKPSDQNWYSNIVNLCLLEDRSEPLPDQESLAFLGASKSWAIRVKQGAALDPRSIPIEPTIPREYLESSNPRSEDRSRTAGSRQMHRADTKSSRPWSSRSDGAGRRSAKDWDGKRIRRVGIRGEMLERPGGWLGSESRERRNWEVVILAGARFEFT